MESRPTLPNISEAENTITTRNITTAAIGASVLKISVAKGDITTKKANNRLMIRLMNWLCVNFT